MIFPRGYDHGQRLQGWSTAICLFAFKLYMVAATQLITSFCFFFLPLRAVGVAASSRFFGSASSWRVLSSQTQFPPGRYVRNFAAFGAYFTIGKSVSSSSSVQGCLVRVHGLCGRHNSGVLREGAVTDCVPFLEVSIFPLFHALADCGRRCFTGASARFQSTHRWSLKLALRSNSFFIGDWPYHSILNATPWCTLWSSGQI